MTTPSPPPSTLRNGGAWETIIDKAVTQVSEYLASSTQEFDPAAALSVHMLSLLDRGTLRSILVERNYNELCGCFGCGNRPRGLQWNLEKGGEHTLNFDWPSSASSTAASESDTDGDEASGEEPKNGQGSRSSAARHTNNGAHSVPPVVAGSQSGDNEEIVYEDDLYTAESFRLAQRQRTLLNRIQEKRLLKEGVSAPPSAAAAPSPRVRRSGMLGASFPQRFCSAECEDIYESGIMPRVSPYLRYEFLPVFSALTNLFPNLRVAALQQLAGAEVSASWLVRPVQENGVTDPRADTVTVRASCGSSEHLRSTHEGGTPSGSDKKMEMAPIEMQTNDRREEEEAPPLLRTVLEQMQVLRGVWNHEVAPRFSESHMPRVPAEQINANEKNHQVQLPVASAAPSQGAFHPSAPRTHLLRGSLLLCDFIMNTSSAKTRRLFYEHYVKHRTALQANVSRAIAAAAADSRPAPFFLRISEGITAAMEAKYRCLHADSDEIDRRVTEDTDVVGDDLRIDPALQQQRCALLTAYIFSEEVSATLSRLLMVDYVLLINVAWSGVWFRDLPLKVNGAKELCSLQRSLLFPFALPAVLLRAAGSSPEVVGLAMIYLMAAGCCSDAVWAGCMAGEVAFDEVADVIGLTEADVTAAVRSLMLDEGE
ncbi:hypothetical protein ABL78_1311 [Leptomonas seymouri]|uniref:Uncharacterized protein n=1 Tax=Leptomonas seymouri TaxID=5684 RepID=A0A0N1IAT3_LEPSE|nr:hypothetical protein ABL78_1311 [Leptomonas seymouri]|eukprot:KPI89543.1 hypothetical protein ABL78_1311 [Leptomonas seymouri]